MTKVTRYDKFTHIKIKNEYVPVLSQTTRQNNDGKGWITYYTPKGDFTDKDHKGFYIEGDFKRPLV
jgi:hypothetical protein